MIKVVRYFPFIFLFFLCSLLLSPAKTMGETLTHVVQKGDTLWDISEKYYGDPELWPKLWEMNPFVTNPHLLNPGDVITLLKGVPLKGIKPTEEETVPGTAPQMKGIDFSGVINIDMLGYLSREKLKPWGTVFTADSPMTLLSKGTTIYVNFAVKKEINPGDEFIICRSSPRLNHPLNKKRLGYLITFTGKFVIKEHFKKNIYKAKIVEAHRVVRVGDLFIPQPPLSPCLRPTSTSEKIVENIVAVSDRKVLIGQYSIVYLNRGFLNKVRRGMIFDVVKQRVVPDPDVKVRFLTDYSKKLELPDLVLGQLIILESRPNTSTALILSAKEDFRNGAVIKSLSWVETPQALKLLPSCTLE